MYASMEVVHFVFAASPRAVDHQPWQHGPGSVSFLYDTEDFEDPASQERKRMERDKREAGYRVSNAAR
jgi:hypothetical protein